MATIIGKNPLGTTETIIGSPGNDVIDGFGGVDYIDGGAGADTVIFYGSVNDFTVTTDNEGVARVVAKLQTITIPATATTPEKTEVITTFYSSAEATTVDTLINVERILFKSPDTINADGTVEPNFGITVSLPPTSTDAYFANYVLSPSSTKVNEDGTIITYTLKTGALDNTNISAGIILNYTLSGSGIAAADIVGGSLTGQITVTDGNAEFTVAVAADHITEGAESLMATLTSTSGTKLAIAPAVIISDTSMSPTYKLSTASSVNEGDSATYTLATTDVTTGTVLNYTLSGPGITAADIAGGPLSGSVTVDANGTGTFTVAVAADYLLEGQEPMTATLTSANGTTLATAPAVIIISDTSMTPTYKLSTASSVNEGASATYTLIAAGVDAGTVLNYTLSGSGITAADIANGSLNGSVTVGASGTSTFTVAVAADHVSEGTESIIATLTSANGTTLATAPAVISDTSLTPAYKLSTASSVNEGANATYTLATAGVDTGTVLNYTLSGPGITAADITGGSLSGSVTVGANGMGIFTVALTADHVTEGPESMTTTLISTNGATLATAPIIIVNDTSIASAVSASTVLNGTSFADNFAGAVGNEVIDGGAGIDTVSYAGKYSSFTVTANSTEYTTLISNQFGIDNIKNIERIHFSDKWFANDISGNAGTVAKVIIAAFGATSIDQYMAVGLTLTDAGKSLNDLCSIITIAKLIESASGDSSTKGYVNTLFTNVVGRIPNALESITYENMINSESITRSGLLELAATTSLAQDIVGSLNIDLLGISYSPSL